MNSFFGNLFVQILLIIVGVFLIAAIVHRLRLHRRCSAVPVAVVPSMARDGRGTGRTAPALVSGPAAARPSWSASAAWSTNAV